MYSSTSPKTMDHYFVPPLSSTELFQYNCHETGSAGFFILEKKIIKGVVESVKATHAFVFGDGETMNVKIKVKYEKRVGLIVEVKEPVKLTVDHIIHLISRIDGKMESMSVAGALKKPNQLLPSIDDEEAVTVGPDKISVAGAAFKADGEIQFNN
ncbi:uncharacterized protein LOC113852695 [Abrus precatorius]|uniref:Uncharacterized protein LOC113852695 n=1 Tax=Abrus precatorius TaxID=3816 RepID=A0A8B8K511_ABRPR|nr:uncharacterized protein LOC113852695 [Abrus precatorius]